MKKLESVENFLEFLKHVAEFSAETEMEKLQIMEEILVRVIKNKNIGLNFKSQILDEYKNINEQQLANLGAIVKSKFPRST